MSGARARDPAQLAEEARRIAGAVCDPEIPVLTIADLGVLRAVQVCEAGVEVTITPTYSGCPAMAMIAVEIEMALARADIGPVVVRRVLAPAWTTDLMTEEGRRKLRAYGIAPPARTASRRALFGVEAVACPRCGAADTEEIAPFGSTSCKALWRCKACREPFDHFKCH